MDTSQKALVISSEELGATNKIVDDLTEMLSTTFVKAKDTQSMFTQVNTLMSEMLSSTIEEARSSLQAAEEAAKSWAVAIKSFETFRANVGATPFLRAIVPNEKDTYNPDKPPADSLGELSECIEDMPNTFMEMSANFDKADDNLELIKSNLESMSKNTALIAVRMNQYQSMIGDSETSMGNL